MFSSLMVVELLQLDSTDSVVNVLCEDVSIAFGTMKLARMAGTLSKKKCGAGGRLIDSE